MEPATVHGIAHEAAVSLNDIELIQLWSTMTATRSPDAVQKVLRGEPGSAISDARLREVADAMSERNLFSSMCLL